MDSVHLQALAARLAEAVRALAREPAKLGVHVLAGQRRAVFVVRCASDDVDRLTADHGAEIGRLRESVCEEAHRLGVRAFVNVHRLPIRRIRVGAPA